MKQALILKPLVLLPMVMAFVFALTACAADTPDINLRVENLNSGLTIADVANSLDVEVGQSTRLVASFADRQTGDRDRFDWILTENGVRVPLGDNVTISSSGALNGANRDIATLTFNREPVGDLVLTVRAAGSADRSVTLNVGQPTVSITTGGMEVTDPVAMVVNSGRQFHAVGASGNVLSSGVTWSLTQGGVRLPAAVANVTTGGSITFNSVPTGEGAIHLTAHALGVSSQPVVLTVSPANLVISLANGSPITGSVAMVARASQTFNASFASGESANVQWSLTQGGNPIPTSVANVDTDGDTTSTSTTVTFHQMPTGEGAIHLHAMAHGVASQHVVLTVAPAAINVSTSSGVVGGGGSIPVTGPVGMVALAQQSFTASFATGGTASNTQWTLTQGTGANVVNLVATNQATLGNDADWNGYVATGETVNITFNQVPLAAAGPIHLNVSAPGAAARPPIVINVAPATINVTTFEAGVSTPITGVGPVAMNIDTLRRFDASLAVGNATNFSWQVRRGDTSATAITLPDNVVRMAGWSGNNAEGSSATVIFDTNEMPGSGRIFLEIRMGSFVREITLTLTPAPVPVPPPYDRSNSGATLELPIVIPEFEVPKSDLEIKLPIVEVDLPEVAEDLDITAPDAPESEVLDDDATAPSMGD